MLELEPNGLFAGTDYKDMKTVYLVEDNQDSADLVADVLSDHCAVVHFPEAYAALHAIQDSSRPLPDLLILDISLPGIDGVSLLRMIRSEPRTNHLAAIALTAHAMKADEVRLLLAGFNAYVSKPLVDETVLVRAVQSWVGKPNLAKV
jgi:CheY-like chemotaxis protein